MLTRLALITEINAVSRGKATKVQIGRYSYSFYP